MSAIKKLEQVSETLRTALAAPRLEYRARFRQHVRAQVDEIAAKLAQNNLDLNKVAPYPASYGPTYKGRNAYIAAMELNQFAWRFFEGTDKYAMQRSGSDQPYFVAARKDWDKTLDKMADEATAKYFDGYIIKLANKIGKPVVSAELVGSLWTNCTLNVICEDFEPQFWHTQCIFNVSCLGRVFNQWPTRRKKV